MQAMKPPASGTTVVHARQERAPSTRTSNKQTLQVRPTTTTTKAPASAATSASGGSIRQRRCRAKGCMSPSSYSKDGLKPAVFCGNHRKFSMIRVAHGDKTCGHEGCDRPADVGHMAQNGVIERFCSAHKMSTIVASTRIEHCKRPGCSNTPSYGVKEGPLSFCSSHKRVGMFTNRYGTLLVATRNGDAFAPSEDIASAMESSSAPKSNGEPAASPSKKALDHVSEVQGSLSSARLAETPSSKKEKMPSMYRKLCEVPGCMVQPSYGKQGTSRAQFCTSHKKKGMIALKNRPCRFPGCNTRPNFGTLENGRALYCVTHRKKGMVRISRETLAQKKDSTREDAYTQEATSVKGTDFVNAAASAKGTASAEGTASAKGAASAKEAASAKGTASAKEAASAKGAASAKVDASVKGAASANGAASAKVAASAKEAASAKVAASAKEAASARGGVSAKEASSEKEAASEQRAASAEGVGATKGGTAANEAASVVEAASAKAIASAKATASVKGASSAKVAASAKEATSAKVAALVKGAASAKGAASVKAEASTKGTTSAKVVDSAKEADSAKRATSSKEASSSTRGGASAGQTSSKPNQPTEESDNVKDKKRFRKEQAASKKEKASGEEQASRKRSRSADEHDANPGEDEKRARTSSVVGNSSEAGKKVAIGEVYKRDLDSKGKAKEGTKDSATSGRTKHDTAVSPPAAVPKEAKDGDDGHRGVTSPPAELSVMQKAPSTSSTSDEVTKTVSRPSSNKAPRLKILHRASSSNMASGKNDAVEGHASESSGGGGGRRSRAPSRKALEASGLVEGEEPQLMTKDIREADAKLKKELREQRRKQRAAGLRIGLVLEVVAVKSADGAGSDRGRGGGAGGSSSVEVGNVRDRRAMAGDAESIEPISSGKKRRKASTPEVAAIPRTDLSSSTKDTSTASSSGECPRVDVQESRNGGTQKTDKTTSGSPNERRLEMTVDDHDVREHEREQVVRQVTVRESGKPDTTPRRSAMAVEEGRPSGSKTEVAGTWGWMEESSRGYEPMGAPVLCFEGCGKPASFGVNGTARYCKTHSLFGMRKITAK